MKLPSTKTHNITLAVLAGGRASRMGIAKAQLTIHGKPILKHLLETLNWNGPKILVTARDRTSPPGAELFDFETVDPVEGQGPLRGILTALEACTTDLIVVTVDMPGITPDMLIELIDAMEHQPSIHGMMFARTAGDEKGLEPFPCLVRPVSRDAIAAAIHAGRRSVRGLLKSSGFCAIEAHADWPDSVWTNLNTPEDLRAFENSLTSDDKM